MKNSIKILSVRTRVTTEIRMEKWKELWLSSQSPLLFPSFKCDMLVGCFNFLLIICSTPVLNEILCRNFPRTLAWWDTLRKHAEYIWKPLCTAPCISHPSLVESQNGMNRVCELLENDIYLRLSNPVSPTN